MKKHSVQFTRFLPGAALILGALGLMTACLDPLGFTPEVKLKVDATITGELDTKDVTSAVLQVVNHTTNLDVETIKITQPDWQPPPSNPNAHAPSWTLSNTPLRQSKKAQYVPPHDASYQVELSWRDYKDEAPGTGLLTHPTLGQPGTKTITIPLPLPKQVVDLHIYRNKNGEAVITTEAGGDNDGILEDPEGGDDTDGEGSVPAEIPGYNRNKMGVFVVLNMTKSQPVDGVSFRKGNWQYNSMVNVMPRDQQSIALGQGGWETVLYYTASGDSRELGPVNCISVPVTDPQAFRSNYLYFYRTRNNSYNVSHVWPPYPNDAADEENQKPEDMLDDDHGILQITNKSETNTVIKGIKINGDTSMSYPDVLYPSQFQQFILPVGRSYVSFWTDKTNGDYGQQNPVYIEGRKIFYLNYYDNLGQPDAVEPGTGLIKIINNTLQSYATHVNVIDPDTGWVLPWPESLFVPAGSVGPGSVGRLTVHDVPPAYIIYPNRQYKIQVIVRHNLSPGQGVEYFALEYQRVLYNNLVEIVLTEDAVKAGARVKSMINVENLTTEAGIVSMQVIGPFAQKSLSPPSPVFRPHTYSETFKSTDDFPIVYGTKYLVRIILKIRTDEYVVDKTGLELYNRIVNLQVTDADLGPDYKPPIYYDITADGGPAQTTTKLIFTFNHPNPGVGINDIVFVDSTCADKGTDWKQVPYSDPAKSQYELTVTAKGNGPVTLKINRSPVETGEKFVYVWLMPVTGPFRPVTNVTFNNVPGGNAVVSANGESAVLKGGMVNKLKWNIVPPDSTHGHPSVSGSSPAKWSAFTIGQGDWDVSYDSATEELTIRLGANWQSQAYDNSRFFVIAYVDKGTSEEGTTWFVSQQYPADLAIIAGSLYVQGKPYWKLVEFSVTW